MATDGVVAIIVITVVVSMDLGSDELCNSHTMNIKDDTGPK